MALSDMIAAMASSAWAVCREIRARAGLSQRALAALAGVPPATVARIERGRMEPTLALLERLARAAGLELRPAVCEQDPGERATRFAARTLSLEDRLKENDRLSALWVAGRRSGDAAR